MNREEVAEGLERLSRFMEHVYNAGGPTEVAQLYRQIYGETLVFSEKFEERLKICEPCEHRRNTVCKKSCNVGLCGVTIYRLAAKPENQCPIGKWDSS